MADFDVNILGCGSALPTTRHMATSQIINLRDKLYMIDCGEGTQLQMRRMRIKFSRLNHIFISHLHGDHCLGLPGLISTFGMVGRTGDLFIYGPKDIGIYLNSINYLFNKNLPFNVVFKSVDTNDHSLIMEDRSLKVYSIPLHHRIPTCGFLFVEKQKEMHLRKEIIDFYQIPIKSLNLIKQGHDFTRENGEVVPNKYLTRPASPAKKYAYCSDTAYYPEIIPLIKDVDLLYHEATFLDSDMARAKETFHSTATQAAIIAQKANVKKLIIGHFSARYESELQLKAEADKIFPNTILANEGLILPV